MGGGGEREGRAKQALQICRMNLKRDIARTLTPGFNVLLNNNSEYQTRKTGQNWIFCFGIFLTLSVFLPSTLCSPKLAFLLGNCQQAYCNDRSNPLLPDQGIPDVTWWRHFVIIPTVPAEGSEIPWKTNKQNKTKILKKVNFSLKPTVLFVCFSFFTYLAKNKKDQYKNPNVFSLLFTWTAQKSNSVCRHS